MLQLKLVLLLTDVLFQRCPFFRFCFSFCFFEKHCVFYTTSIPEVTWYEPLYNNKINRLLDDLMLYYFTYIYIYIYIYIYTMYYFTCLYIYTCIHTHADTHTHTNAYIYIYIYHNSVSYQYLTLRGCCRIVRNNNVPLTVFFDFFDFSNIFISLPDDCRL